MNSGFPPNRMSVPRPAMLVAMVTAPRRPDCATISDSRSTFSGLAFSSSNGMSFAASSSASASLFSTLVVPTRTGRPCLCLLITYGPPSVIAIQRLPSAISMQRSPSPISMQHSLYINLPWCYSPTSFSSTHISKLQFPLNPGNFYMMKWNILLCSI